VQAEDTNLFRSFHHSELSGIYSLLGKACKKILRTGNVNYLVLVNDILQSPENCYYSIKDVLEMVIPVKVYT
jgi:hypothetical protein